MLETPLLPELKEGLTAVDEGDIEAAQRALAVVREKLGEDHPRVHHLRGSIAWAQGDMDAAQVDLQRAVLACPTDPDLCLDSAELSLRVFNDLDAAERTIADLLRAPNLPADAQDEAHFMMARSMSAREEDEALEQALTHLASISSENQGEPACISLKAEVLLDLGRGQDALTLLETAIEQEGEDPDLHYLACIAAKELEQAEKITKYALRAHALDCESMGPEENVEDLERQEIRAGLEELFEDLPEKLLRMVANAPIEVVARLSVEQVKAGADPRAVVLFEGQCASHSAQGADGSSDAKLEKIVIIRDMLIYGVEEDDPDEVGDVLLGSLASEIQRFFGLEDLVVASG